MTFQYQNAHTVTLELAPFVIRNARERAAAIEDENERAGRPAVQGQSGYGPDSVERRVSGYCGESAVAALLGLDPVRGTGDHFQNRPDVGGFDVMTTKRHDGRLIFTPKNPLWSVKVLVVDESPFFHVCGCYPCAEARNHPEWWQVPRPNGGCWMVPQPFLREIDAAPDTKPVPESVKRDLLRFSRDWRGALRAAGLRDPNDLTPNA